MSRTPSRLSPQPTEYNLKNFNTNKTALNILNDLESAKSEIIQHVDYAKALVAGSLGCYKKKSTEVLLMITDKDVKKIFNKGLDEIDSIVEEGPYNFTRQSESFSTLIDRVGTELWQINNFSKTLVEEGEHNNTKKTESFSILIDKVEMALWKINNISKGLAENTKLAIRQYLPSNAERPGDTKNVGKIGDVASDMRLNLLKRIRAHIRENERIVKSLRWPTINLSLDSLSEENLEAEM